MKRHRSTRGGRTSPHPGSRLKDPLRDRLSSPSPKPGYNPNAAQMNRVKLLSNAYSLGTTKVVPNIHEYELIIEPSIGCKDLPSHFLIRNNVIQSIRRLLMDQLIPRLLGTNAFDSSIIIESKLSSIFSVKRFSLSGPSNDDDLEVSVQGEEFSFQNLSLSNDLFNRLHINIVIKYKASFTLNLADRNFTLLSSIIHHQLLLRAMKYGSVYYDTHNRYRGEMQGNRFDLISDHIMGISISNLRSSADGQNMVVINCPHSYITRSYRLIDLLGTFIAEKPIPNLKLLHHADNSMIRLNRMPEISGITGAEEWFATFCTILNGYKCKAFIPENNHCLKFSLTQESAASLKFGDSITVQDYYYKEFNINLNYPNLPCLKSQFNRHPYHPLELCVLLPDQKVPVFRLSTKARNHLGVLNKPRPDESQQSSSRARDQIESINLPHFIDYGVRLSRHSVEAEGAILNKPNLKYQNQVFEPSRDFWESGIFYKPMRLVGNWCVVNTVMIDDRREDEFFSDFSNYSRRFGFELGRPHILVKMKQEILDQSDCIEILTNECLRLTDGHLRFIMFVIDSSSTLLNRLIHLSFDEQPNVTATCLRKDSIMNVRQHRAIFRTLVHKLNARLGGTNVTFNECTLANLSLCGDDLMIIGLDVTHPDNELSGVSIVGCAYTYSNDLFKHKSLVWPQEARVEIISRMDVLMRRLLHEYHSENNNCLPKQIIIYRDGVSHEEFEKVRNIEIRKAQMVLEQVAEETDQPKPNLSYIIAQKRHTMRFFQIVPNNIISNPPSGTLIDRDVVALNGREFYLYSNTNPQATARPLHYHVLLNGLGVENLQKLTYFLCFNFGKCSGTLSMPSSLKYAHNAAYDARNRVIAAREFSENKFYASKFFC